MAVPNTACCWSCSPTRASARRSCPSGNPVTGLPDIYGERSAQTSNYARFGVEFVRGEGAHLYDADGNAYLDLLCGIGVNNVGHCHPAVVTAVREQVGTLMHTSN
ncbi:MAG: aminotransferase class III-fold pyridoxal phosphate-dependent enzyme, partial [Thermoleophilia bacterium]|nr:aminotransferase class III-fold pyridoxal phosphate-dependent enzyme [Thermoleophilia bacterium]